MNGQICGAGPSQKCKTCGKYEIGKLAHGARRYRCVHCKGLIPTTFDELGNPLDHTIRRNSDTLCALLGISDPSELSHAITRLNVALKHKVCAYIS